VNVNRLIALHHLIVRFFFFFVFSLFFSFTTRLTDACLITINPMTRLFRASMDFSSLRFEVNSSLRRKCLMSRLSIRNFLLRSITRSRTREHVWWFVPADWTLLILFHRPRVEKRNIGNKWARDATRKINSGNAPTADFPRRKIRKERAQINETVLGFIPEEQIWNFRKNCRLSRRREARRRMHYNISRPYVISCFYEASRCQRLRSIFTVILARGNAKASLLSERQLSTSDCTCTEWRIKIRELRCGATGYRTGLPRSFRVLWLRVNRYHVSAVNGSGSGWRRTRIRARAMTLFTMKIGPWRTRLV